MIYLLKHCPPNPTLKYADSIVLPEGTTEIVSEGGGSTIDVGKWIARKYNLKHTVIPTTAGTGSEVTRFCVLTTNGVKKTYVDTAFIPNSYVLDPKIVVSLPPLQTLASGLDALSQSVESLWSRNATSTSSDYAAASIQLIVRNLDICLAFPDSEEARMNMLIAANLSGRAINITKTNVCHAISYPLTDLYGIPHGIACGMTLRYFAKKAKMMNVYDFLLKLNIPKFEGDKQQIAEIAITSEKLQDCPFIITKDDIVKSLS